ncbi:MAG TPA: efflux RND transporter periplasmic adaptor subunit [Bryobacteraceae bacterium]
MTVEEQNTDIVEPVNGTMPEKTAQQKPARAAWRVLLVIFLVLGLALGYAIFTGLVSRAKAETALAQETKEQSVPTVAVAYPKAAAGADEVVIPGNMQAFIDTPIWARSSGYLRQWYVDIGGRVTKGQLLAEIDAPEVDQQLQQARAELVTAQANLKLSQVTAERYTNLFKTDSVAKQDVDNAVQDEAAKTAAVTSSQANVARLEQLVSYEKVYAPFAGVITVRNTDVGALVDAGANTTGKELFHLASTATLRVYVNVPEAYSRAAKPGVTAALTLSEFPGRQFHGVVVRNASSIDAASRTLLVEVDVKNPGGELLPGSYVSVHLKLPSRIPAVTVSSSALLFRSEGLRVAVVKNGRIELAPITLGRDFGDEVEVTSGVTSRDAVIVNPSDSIAAGQQVQVANSGTGHQAE